MCFVAAAMMLFAACGKGEEDPTVYGTWQLVSYESNGNNYTANATWVFGQDGVITMTTGGIASSGTFTVDGSKMTWDFGYGVEELTIVTLTASELELFNKKSSTTYHLQR